MLPVIPTSFGKKFLERFKTDGGPHPSAGALKPKAGLALRRIEALCRGIGVRRTDRS